MAGSAAKASPAEARNSAGNLSSKAPIMVKAMPYLFRNFPNTYAGVGRKYVSWLLVVLGSVLDPNAPDKRQ
jgi:hypothetical protein